MKNFIFLTLITLFFAACSGPKSTVSSEVTIFSASSLMRSFPETAEIFVYGSSREGNFFSQKISTSNLTLELPKGVWEISAVVWDNEGTSSFGGTLECGKVTNLNLTDSIDKTDFEIIITEAGCKGRDFFPFFTEDPTILTLSFPQVFPLTCLDNSLVTSYASGVAKCFNEPSKGPGTYYRIKYYDTSNLDSLRVIKTPVGYSACYSAGNPGPSIPFNFPAGAMVIEYFFAQTPCSAVDGVMETNLKLFESTPTFENLANNTIGFFINSDRNLLPNPRALLAPISTITRTSVVLTWNEAGGKALDYKAVKSTSPILTCEVSDARTIKASSRSASLPQFTTTFTDLLPETLYYFRVCSVDRDGNISSGIQITATTDERVKVTGISRTITASGGSGEIIKGDTIIFNVTFSDNLESVDSDTLLKLNLKNTSVYATNPAITGNIATFTYTADYGDYHPTAADSITVDSIIGSAEATDSTDVNIEILATSSFKSFSGVQIITCPTSQSIHVPRNPIFGDYNFCVMKYEAQDDSAGVGATSGPSEAPWVSILASDAEDACEATDYNGDDLSLISNNEWMTIARNVQGVATNKFSDGGNTHIYRGHTDDDWSDPPTTGLITAGADTNTSDGEDGYIFTGNSAADSKEQRRTLYLSNDEVIWDFSGNAAEWVDVETLPVCSEGLFSNENCPSFGPSADSTLGLGKVINALGSLTYLARGGDFDDVANAGIYSILYSDDNDYPNIGFRCVLRPDSER
jgi:hypothetical protein